MWPNWIKELNYNELKNRDNLEVLSVGRLETQKIFEEIIMALENTNFLLLSMEMEERKKITTFC